MHVEDLLESVFLNVRTETGPCANEVLGEWVAWPIPQTGYLLVGQRQKSGGHRHPETSREDGSERHRDWLAKAWCWMSEHKAASQYCSLIMRSSFIKQRGT